MFITLKSTKIMAKQSGLHQLRGKVGEHSYYRQTGVSAGLVRSINQGLSARVKTGEEYANTRLNNAEFGQACKIAAQVIRYITPKFRPMILPFSQSKMAKMLLEVIKTQTGNWGQRNITDADGATIAPLLSTLAKNNFDEYGVSVFSQDDAMIVEADGILSAAKLAAIGADGYKVRLVLSDTWIGTYVQSESKYAKSYARANIYDGSIVANGTTQFDPADYPADPPTGWPATGCRMAVLMVMPYRTINSQDYILQEYCTFKAFEFIPIGG